MTQRGGVRAESSQTDIRVSVLCLIQPWHLGHVPIRLYDCAINVVEVGAEFELPGNYLVITLPLACPGNFLGKPNLGVVITR